MKLDLVMDKKLLAHTQNTPPQVIAPLHERRGKVQDTFRRNGPVNKRLAISVGDVATPGSTLSACAAALKAAGASSV